MLIGKKDGAGENCRSRVLDLALLAYQDLVRFSHNSRSFLPIRVVYSRL